MIQFNWSAPNIWAFIAQLAEHSSGNAEAMGSNPVEALKFFILFFRAKICSCLNCKCNCDDHIFSSFIFAQFMSTSFQLHFKDELDKLVCEVHMALYSSVERALQR